MYNEVKKEKAIIQFVCFFLFIKSLQKITQIVTFLEYFYLLYISKVNSFFFEKDQNYDFDLTGNLLKLTDNPNNSSVSRSIQNYSYDPLGRISSADGTYKGGVKSYNEKYSFDNDNRILEKTFKRDKGGETKYTFRYQNTDHAIRSIDITGSANGERRVEFNYDDFGNMTKKTLKKDSETSITEFKYDETNKLTQIQWGAENN
jgi:YD repeat-containing protein